MVSLKIKLIDFLLELIEMGKTRGDRAPFIDAANEVNQGGTLFATPAILASKAYRLYRLQGCSDEIATTNSKYLLNQLLQWKKEQRKTA